MQISGVTYYVVDRVNEILNVYHYTIMSISRRKALGRIGALAGSTVFLGMFKGIDTAEKVLEVKGLKGRNEKVSKDLSVYWDTVTPLANPDKGWYHHLLAGGVEIYDIKDQAVLEQFPGMDNMYLRIAWSYIESTEGEYDWSIIDNVIDEYVPRGYGISFRITSKETGTYPGSVGQEFAGVAKSN